MKLDLHIHTSYSPDGKVDPKDVLKIAKKLGIDAIAITDHNEIKGALKARSYGILPVIIGEEVSTLSGHVLAYNIECLIPRGLTVEETIEKIQECSGIAVIAHPYRYWSGVGEKETIKNIRHVDGIEIFNGRCKERSNKKAKTLAEKYNKFGTGGSDAHFPEHIGKAGVVTDCYDIPECLKNAKTFGSSRTSLETIAYVKKAVGEWIKRGFKRI